MYPHPTIAAAQAASAPARLGERLRAHAALLAILACGLLVRLAVAGAMSGVEPRIVDEQHYVQLATSLLHGRGFAFADGTITSIRPPLYPALLATTWAVAGESLTAVRLLQAGLGVVNVWLLYVLALRLFDRRVALMAAVVFCFYPSLLFFTGLLLTETLFTLLLTLALWLGVDWLERPSARGAALFGVTLGLSALTRSVFWPLIIPLTPIAFALTPGRAWTRARVAAALVLGYVLVVGPWSVRNTRLQGTFTVIDTMGGLNLRMGNYEHTPEDRMWDAVALDGDRHWAAQLRRDHPDASTWSEGRKDKWAQRQALAYIASHPAQTLERAVIKFADFWGLERELAGGFRQGLYAAPGWFVLVALATTAAAYAGVVLLASLGVSLAMPADRRAHVLLLLVVVAMCGAHVIVFGHSRYHLPLVPILAMYAAAAVSARAWRRLPRGGAPTAIALVLSVVMMTIWVREVWVVDRDRLFELLKVLG